MIVLGIDEHILIINSKILIKIITMFKNKGIKKDIIVKINIKLIKGTKNKLNIFVKIFISKKLISKIGILERKAITEI